MTFVTFFVCLLGKMRNAEVDRISAAHLAKIEQKIADLKRLAKELRRLNNCCQGNGVIADCRIIEALSPAL